MNPLGLEIHPLAVEDARAALRWYRRRSPATANRLLGELDRAIQRIVSAPRQFPSYLLGTRVYHIPRFPVLVVYLEDNQAVQVLAVAHGKRRPGYWRRRMP
jgi:plasmid stabilization system protein ParE